MKFFVKFANGFIHEINTSDEESARIISESLFPNLKIVSVETNI